MFRIFLKKKWLLCAKTGEPNRIGVLGLEKRSTLWIVYVFSCWLQEVSLSMGGETGGRVFSVSSFIRSLSRWISSIVCGAPPIANGWTVGGNGQQRGLQLSLTAADGDVLFRAVSMDEETAATTQQDRPFCRSLPVPGLRPRLLSRSYYHRQSDL